MIPKTLALTTILMSFAGAGFAQSDIYAKAVPDQVDGKDYAGRRVGEVKLPPVPPLSPSQQQQFQQDVKDVHFDFDRSELRDEDRTILAGDAEWLKAHPDVFITLEGDADERGDIVYNVVLSDRRAIVTRDALVELGVPSNRILFATGWGKLYPICTQPDESCWSQNRRTHIASWQPTSEATQLAAR
jgi:outer membrane protein OmpA-like peptidoglycan-associated protein